MANDGGNVNRRRLGRWEWVGLTGSVAVAVMLEGALPHAHVSVDTVHLIAGARASITCLRAGHLSGCGLVGHTHQNRVGPFPLLQYLPTMAMIQAGLSDRSIERGLGWMSYAALPVLVALLAFGWPSTSLRPRVHMWRALLVVGVLSGPILYYSTSPFGEMVSTTLVVASIVVVLRRRIVGIVVLTFLAGLTKETLPFFVLLLGLIAGRRAGDRWLPPWPVSVAVLSGSGLALAVNDGFNWFRFRSLSNTAYLQKYYDISHTRAARNLWNLLVAPGGGVIWFWTAIALLLVALAWTGMAQLRREPGSALPAVAVLVVAGGFVVSLAMWWSPFGWVAWGPRLDVPLLPAIALVAVHAGGRRLDDVVAWVLRHLVTFVALAAVVVAAAWPEAAAPWRSKALTRLILVRDGSCASQPARYTERYYDCLDHIAWRRAHNQLLAALHGNRAPAVATQVLLAVTVVALLLGARTVARTRPATAAPSA